MIRQPATANVGSSGSEVDYTKVIIDYSMYSGASIQYNYIDPAGQIVNETCGKEQKKMFECQKNSLTITYVDTYGTPSGGYGANIYMQDDGTLVIKSKYVSFS